MAIYYASGSNRPGEIRGFADIGHPVGTVADEVLRSPATRAELLATAGQIPVFVDSGAFSEVTFGLDGPRVVKPITDTDWRRRLALYDDLARSLGPALSVVAPDKVGFPGETLYRLSRYRREIQEVAQHGARILVALQGADKLDFWRKVLLLNLAPVGQLVAALPMMKNATPDNVVVEFARKAHPHGLHLLGLGLTKKSRALLARIEAAAPETELSLDACLIRRHVGRKSRMGKMTAALDRASEQLDECRWSEGAPASSMSQSGDYTDQITTPSAWITPMLSKRFVADAGLSPADARRWKHDPDAFVRENYVLPHVDHALDKAWATYQHLAVTNERKRRGIVMAFGKPSGKRRHAASPSARRPKRRSLTVALRARRLRKLARGSK